MVYKDPLNYIAIINHYSFYANPETLAMAKETFMAENVILLACAVNLVTIHSFCSLHFNT